MGSSRCAERRAADGGVGRDDRDRGAAFGPGALHFSNESRQWVVTAYALAFGSLLLVGGKVGDLFGRKWALIAGLVGFSAASAVGGLAQSFDVLVAARALQGVFGALLAPAALSLLTVTFAGTADWGRAFGIFGAVAGGAGALGLLLGGVLTQVLSWRWCLYVNVGSRCPRRSWRCACS
jgi:MFS family permease